MRGAGALFALTLAANVCLAGEQLRRIQFWSMGTSTRIAFEFTGDFHYKAAKIENPSRIFFDLPSVTFDLDGRTKGLYTLPVGDRLVKQIRVAPQPAGATRVVIDLEGEALYTASELRAPNRLMIEVYGPGGAPAPSEAPSVTAAIGAPVKQQPRAFQPPPAAPRGRMFPEPMQPAAITVPPALSMPSSQRPLPRALLWVPLPPAALGKAPAPKTLATARKATPPLVPGETTPPAMNPAIATPARANMGGDRSLTRALGLKLHRVVIDPGHGGHDDGTTGYGGLKEKDLVLDLALRTGKLVYERLGADVIYTRETDVFIPLERRPQIANEHHADVFLSIHANSSPIRSVTGVETYFLSAASTRAALEVAARENAAANLSIADLEELVQKITLNDKIRESMEFASRMQYALMNGAGTGPGGKARNRGVRKAPFIVLIGAKMPAILAEVGFLSNAVEEAAMRRSDYRDQIAEALCKGLEAYAQSLSRFAIAGGGGRPDREPAAEPARVTGAPAYRRAATAAARARR